MTNAEEASSHLTQFDSILKEICENNGGYHFISGLKIKNKTQTKALIRIKEKMLGGVYKDLQKELSKRKAEKVKK